MNMDTNIKNLLKDVSKNRYGSYESSLVGWIDLPLLPDGSVPMEFGIKKQYDFLDKYGDQQYICAEVIVYGDEDIQEDPSDIPTKATVCLVVSGFNIDAGDGDYVIQEKSNLSQLEAVGHAINIAHLLNKYQDATVALLYCVENLFNLRHN